VEAQDPPVFFNPFEPGFREDPYPFYARILEVSPRHRNVLGGWVFAGYADCSALLRNPHLTTGSMMGDEREAILRAQGLWDLWEVSAVPDFLDTIVLLKDPPDHTRLRTLMGKVFTPRAVESLRPHIAALVADLLAGVGDGDGGTTDVVEQLAFPLPALVICELLGVPPDEREDLKAWSSAAARLLDPILDNAVFAEADAALRNFQDYFRDLVAERRARPRDDLLSALVHVEDEGERLTDAELLANMTFLFGAGHETTQNLIGNAVNQLSRHPDQYARLRGEPDLVANAVEEFLRYEPPVQVTGRVAVDDVQVDDVTIERGERCVLLLAAANRDPRRFDDPDRLDVARPDVRPLSFGGGIHHCLGAALARVEAQEAIGGFVGAFSSVEPVRDDVEWRENFTLRGPRTLPVTVTR
jgi:cytochrome P450